MIVQIVKTEYTKFVDASVEAFTAQCRALTGMEVQFGTAKPAANVEGVIVPAGLQHGVTRANGHGHGWAKVPAQASDDSASVVVVF